jgi:hypothetical protein
MSPDLAFILSLGARMAVSAAFVVIASMITERSGPAIGALVATLPVSAGPSYISSRSTTTTPSSRRARLRACR